jgi:hypothetical protein
VAADRARAGSPATILRPEPMLPSSVPSEMPATGPVAREMSAPPGRESRAATPLPPIDVEHLTDQVVRHIDKRIGALRERLGRAF